MNTEALFMALGEANDTYITEASAAPPNVRTVPLWMRWTAVAACAVLITALAVVLVPSLSQEEPPIQNAPLAAVTPSSSAKTTTTAPKQEEAPPLIVYPDEEERTVITGTSSGLACYARGPYPGECWIDLYAFPHIEPDSDPNTLFWIELYIHDEAGNQIMTHEKKLAEAERLAALGYEIYVFEESWIGYRGETKQYTHVCGLFTKEHLDRFQTSDEYGYLLDFSPQSIDDCIRICS